MEGQDGAENPRFSVAEQGATAIEYAMLAAVLSVPMLLVFVYLTNEVAVYNLVIARLEVTTWLWLGELPPRTRRQKTGTYDLGL